MPRTLHSFFGCIKNINLISLPIGCNMIKFKRNQIKVLIIVFIEIILFILFICFPDYYVICHCLPTELVIDPQFQMNYQLLAISMALL